MVKRDEKSSLFFYPDIYNKLYSMIKQTWEISNEERNRILSLHESATKNLYLMSEQVEAGNPQNISAELTNEPKWELMGFTIIQRGSEYFVYRPKDLRYTSHAAYLKYETAITDIPDTYIKIPTISELGGVITKGSQAGTTKIVPTELTQNAIYVGEMMNLLDGGKSSSLYYCAFDTKRNIPIFGKISLTKKLYLGSHMVVGYEKVREKPNTLISFGSKNYTDNYGIEISDESEGVPVEPQDTPPIIPPTETPKITTFDIESPFVFDKTELSDESEVKFKEFIENIKKYYNNVTGDVTVTTSASIDSDPSKTEEYNMNLSRRRAQTIIDRLKNESGNKTLNFIANPIGQTDKFKPGAKWPEVKDNNQTAPNRRLIIKLPEVTQ